MNQLSEQCCALRLAAKRVGEKLSQIFETEWSQDDIVQDRIRPAASPSISASADESNDFVVPVSTDQQQMLEIRARQKDPQANRAFRHPAIGDHRERGPTDARGRAKTLMNRPQDQN